MERRLLLLAGPSEGGIGRHLVGLARELAAHRYRIWLLGSLAPFWQEEIRASGVRLCHCDLSGWRSMLQIRALARSIQPQLVHCHGARAALWARLSLPRRLPILYTVHGSPGPALSRGRRWLLRRCERRLVRRTAAYITVSDALARMAQSEWGVPTARLHHIPPGVEVPGRLRGREEILAFLGEESAGETVAFIGRLAPEKGPDTLLGAFAGIAKAFPAARLFFVGDGPLRGPLQWRTQRLGLATRVRFLGFRPDAVSLLPAWDVVVQPSRSEGLSLSILEAMATGRAILATATGGIPELLGGGAGLLLSPGDAPGLAAGLARLLGDPGLRQSLGEEARRRYLCRPDAGESARTTRRVLESLLEGRGSTG